MQDPEEGTKIRLHPAFRLYGDRIIERGTRGNHAELRFHRAHHESFSWFVHSHAILMLNHLGCFAGKCCSYAVAWLAFSLDYRLIIDKRETGIEEREAEEEH